MAKMQTQIDTNGRVIGFYFDNFSGIGRSHTTEQLAPETGEW